MHLSDAFLAVNVFIGGAWILTCNRRKLLTLYEMVPLLNQGELTHFDEFLAAGANILDDDRTFTELSMSYDGLLRRRKNAGIVLQLCQVLSMKADLPKEELTNLFQRALYQSLYTGLAIVCSPIRLLSRRASDPS